MAARGPLSILHVSQPTDGGVAGYVAAVVADQAARGWRVVVAAPSWDGFAERIDAAGAQHVDWTAGRAPGPSAFVDARRLSRIVRDEKPALVHLHSSKAGLAGRLAVRGRLPTIFQPHAWSFEAVRGPLRSLALAWERRAAAWGTILCVGGGRARAGRGARHPRRLAGDSERRRPRRVAGGRSRRALGRTPRPRARGSPDRGLCRTALPPEGAGRAARGLAGGRRARSWGAARARRRRAGCGDASACGGPRRQARRAAPRRLELARSCGRGRPAFPLGGDVDRRCSRRWQRDAAS